MSEEPITITVQGDWRALAAACAAFALDPVGIVRQTNGISVITPKGTIAFSGNGDQCTITVRDAQSDSAAFWVPIFDRLQAMAAYAQDYKRPAARRRVSPLVEPEPDAPMDAWLDWREAARRRGKRITLESIADKGNFSISTLKKHSALRKVSDQRNQSTE